MTAEPGRNDPVSRLPLRREEEISMNGESENTAVAVSPPEEVIVEAGREEARYWRDLWKHRELMYFLVWRDIVVRYKQTLVGIGWSVLRPLVTTLVMVIVFSKLAGLTANGLPYSLFVLTGMVAWQLFAAGLSGAAGGVVSNSGLISKIYFPRLLLPASSILSGLVDYFISLGVLAVFMLWYRFSPSWRVLALPGLTVLTLLAATGLGLWFGALNVRYRDCNNLLGILLQIGVYISPIGFPSSIMQGKWRMVYSCNPMAGIIDGYRWALLGQDTAIYWPGFFLSLALVLLLLVSGIWYFRRTERTFADVI
jgi:lipopolysaccharide transport system permease protein